MFFVDSSLIISTYVVWILCSIFLEMSMVLLNSDHLVNIRIYVIISPWFPALQATFYLDDVHVPFIRDVWVCPGVCPGVCMY